MGRKKSYPTPLLISNGVASAPPCENKETLMDIWVKIWKGQLLSARDYGASHAHVD